MYHGIWSKIRFVCMHHGDDLSNELYIKEGPQSPFYACPKYVSIYTGRTDRSCNNRLNLIDAEWCMNHIYDLSIDGPMTRNVTGMKFTKNGVDYTVLEDNGGKYVVGVLNRKAMAK